MSHPYGVSNTKPQLNVVIFTNAQAYSHATMENLIQEDSKPIAYTPVRDMIDNGFGLE
jgi:hypothetical protein